MPPSSYSCSSLGDTNLNVASFINPLAKEEQLFEDALTRLVGPVQFLDILQSLITCLDRLILINCTAHFQFSSSTHKTINQCELLSHGNNSLRSPVARKASSNNFWSGQKSPVWQHSEGNKESLQHGMALRVSRAEHEESQNDSGFGSGGCQPHSFTFDSRIDLEKLEQNHCELSQCCFYFGFIDSRTSKDLLRKKPTGTFLIRDSSDSRYLYSLSVKTERGATSVRILYSNGLFQFDSDERIRDRLPRFDSVLALLDFHVMVTRDGSNKSWQWEEMSGRKSMKVSLTKPMMNSVPSLAHLSRVKINQCLDNVHILESSVHKLPKLSDELKEYIKEYPYRI